MRVLPLVTHGNACPHCGGQTHRVRMPALLRMVRHISPAVQRRACNNPACAWHGFAHPLPHETLRGVERIERVERIEQLTSMRG